MDDAEKEIELKSMTLNRRMRMFDTDDVTVATIESGEFKEEFQKVKNSCFDLIESIEKMVQMDFKDTMPQLRKDTWLKRLDLIEETVRDYKFQIRDKEVDVRRDLASNTGMTSYQKQHLDLSRQQADQKKIEATVKAKVKFQTILKLCDVLDDKVNEVSEWKEEKDLSVGRNMRKIDSWEKELEKITALNDDLKELVLSNGIASDDVPLDSSNAQMDKLFDDVEASIKAVRIEDDKRALYTLDSAKSDPIKMPLFEGNDDEDFTLFKEKVEKAFVQNRTTKADQLEKLRESLIGYPKKLIPENSTKSVEQAWEILVKAFGDPERIMDFFLDTLKEFGKFPRREGGIRTQIEWLLKIESVVQKIEELGCRDDELADVAFSKNTIRIIVNLFPYKDFDRLNNLPGRRKVKLQAVLNEIFSIREKLQNNVKGWDDKDPKCEESNDGRAQGGGSDEDTDENSDEDTDDNSDEDTDENSVEASDTTKGDNGNSTEDN